MCHFINKYIQIKTIYYAILATVLAFASIIYTSCKKDACSGVSCLNGGSCSKGKCICAPGYTGNNCANIATTFIRFYNHTFTNIIITANDSIQTIPIGGYVIYAGGYGSSLIGGATTNGIAGVTVFWNIINIFPISGILDVALDAPSNLFFLKIANSDAQNINEIITNYNSPVQEIDTVNLQNGGHGYNIGYYYANDSTQVNIYTGTTIHKFDAGSHFSFSLNQSFIAFVP